MPRRCGRQRIVGGKPAAEEGLQLAVGVETRRQAPPATGLARLEQRPDPGYAASRLEQHPGPAGGEHARVDGVEIVVLVVGRHHDFQRRIAVAEDQPRGRQRLNDVRGRLSSDRAHRDRLRVEHGLGIGQTHASLVPERRQLARPRVSVNDMAVPMQHVQREERLLRR